MTTVRSQFRDHAVALISLALALIGLSYNTWRDERTEHNRNIRAAAFEILGRLADFQRVVFLAHYDRDTANGNPRIGWSYIIVINDLAEVVPGAVKPQAAALRDTWRANWENLSKDGDGAIDPIDQKITSLREATVESLRSLR